MTNLITQTLKICHLLKLPLSTFELSAFIVHRLSAHLNNEITKNKDASPETRLEIVKSLSAAIVWVSLQADELVGEDTYGQRDVIHAVWDFYGKELGGNVKEKCKEEVEIKEEVENQEEVKEEAEEEIKEEVKKKVKQEVKEVEENNDNKRPTTYSELNYTKRVYHLESQQMAILRLLNFDIFTIDSILPSTILLHWSKHLFDHKFRPDDIKIQKFNTILFTLYTDSLKIKDLWVFKKDRNVKIEADDGVHLHSSSLDIPDNTGPNTFQTRENCLTLVYLTLKICQEHGHFLDMKFANISMLAGEVKMDRIGRIGSILNNCY